MEIKVEITKILNSRNIAATVSRNQIAIQRQITFYTTQLNIIWPNDPLLYLQYKSFCNDLS